MTTPTKKPASEFRTEMREKGLSADLIDRITKSEITAGTVEDDGTKGMLSGVPMDLLLKSAADIDAALATESLDPDPILASKEFGDDTLGRLEYVENIAKAAAGNGELVIDYQHEVFPALLKGQKAVGMVLQGFMDVMSHFATEIDSIKKGMKEPMAPHGASAESGGFLPHPSELRLGAEPQAGDGIAKGGTPSARVTPISAKVLRGQLMELREDLLQKGGETNRKDIENVGAAITALESGVETPDVVKRFKINFKAASAA